MGLACEKVLTAFRAYVQGGNCCSSFCNVLSFPSLSADPQCTKAILKVLTYEETNSVWQLLGFEIHLAKFIQVSW